MQHHKLNRAALAVLLSSILLLAGCGANAEPAGARAAGAPPPVQVEHESDVNIVKVDRPDRFPIAVAQRVEITPSLDVTGVVNADVSRNVPVISLASGRILEIHTGLGDEVKRGDLLMRVQSPDISQAFSDYRQAQADEALSAAQLARSRLLFDKGAIAQKDLEVAVDAEAKAKVVVETARGRIRVLGADPEHPGAVVDVRAPISGVITDQQVTAAAGTQGLASPNAFTISDLSRVWVVCDVFENDLSFVRVGEYADVRLNAYPNMVLRGRIANVGPILDPAVRSAKVRIELANNGAMRLGMFVTATFHSAASEQEVAVPAAAILHLHDRDWVYLQAEGGRFERREVTGGAAVAGNLQAAKGLKAGDRVVANALVLENTVEQ